MEKNFWLTVSTNGMLTRLCHKWKDFAFFGRSSGVVDCDWRRKFFETGDNIRFFSVTTRFFCGAIRAISASYVQFQQFSPHWSFEYVTAGFAFFTVVERRSFIG